MTTTRNHPASQTTGQEVRVLIRVLLRVGEQTYPLGDAELACDTPAMRAWLAHAPLPHTPGSPITEELRQHIATVCERFGMDEPLYEQLGEQEARALLARLQAEEEDLFQTAALARTSSSSEQATPSYMEPALIRQLKERWRARFRPAGSVDDLRRNWEHFKQRVCGQEVPDRRMSANQYEQVLAALTEAPSERR